MWIIFLELSLKSFKFLIFLFSIAPYKLFSHNNLLNKGKPKTQILSTLKHKNNRSLNDENGCILKVSILISNSNMPRFFLSHLEL